MLVPAAHAQRPSITPPPRVYGGFDGKTAKRVFCVADSTAESVLNLMAGYAVWLTLM